MPQALLLDPRPDSGSIHVHGIPRNAEFGRQLVGRAIVQYLSLEARPRCREGRPTDLSNHSVEHVLNPGPLRLVGGVVARLIRGLMSAPGGLRTSPAEAFPDPVLRGVA